MLVYSLRKRRQNAIAMVNVVQSVHHAIAIDWNDLTAWPKGGLGCTVLLEGVIIVRKCARSFSFRNQTTADGERHFPIRSFSCRFFCAFVEYRPVFVLLIISLIGIY